MVRFNFNFFRSDSAQVRTKAKRPVIGKPKLISPPLYEGSAAAAFQARLGVTPASTPTSTPDSTATTAPTSKDAFSSKSDVSRAMSQFSSKLAGALSANRSFGALNEPLAQRLGASKPGAAERGTQETQKNQGSLIGRFAGRLLNPMRSRSKNTTVQSDGTASLPLADLSDVRRAYTPSPEPQSPSTDSSGRSSPPPARPPLVRRSAGTVSLSTIYEESIERPVRSRLFADETPNSSSRSSVYSSSFETSLRSNALHPVVTIEGPEYSHRGSMDSSSVDNSVSQAPRSFVSELLPSPMRDSRLMSYVDGPQNASHETIASPFAYWFQQTPTPSSTHSSAFLESGPRASGAVYFRPYAVTKLRQQITADADPAQNADDAVGLGLLLPRAYTPGPTAAVTFGNAPAPSEAAWFGQSNSVTPHQAIPDIETPTSPDRPMIPQLLTARMYVPGQTAAAIQHYAASAESFATGTPASDFRSSMFGDTEVSALPAANRTLPQVQVAGNHLQDAIYAGLRDSTLRFLAGW